MLILGPLVWATTSALTVTPDRALASLVTSEPSTSRSAGSCTAAPAAPSSFSTSTTSPTATLYCLPPVLTMAYTTAPRSGHGARARDSTPQDRIRLPEASGSHQTSVLRRWGLLRGDPQRGGA